MPSRALAADVLSLLLCVVLRDSLLTGKQKMLMSLRDALVLSSGACRDENSYKHPRNDFSRRKQHTFDH